MVLLDIPHDCDKLKTVLSFTKDFLVEPDYLLPNLSE
jgi:hypothetical protein